MAPGNDSNILMNDNTLTDAGSVAVVKNLTFSM